MLALPFDEPVLPLVDIGVNLCDPAFAADLEAVLERAAAAGITGLLLTPRPKKYRNEPACLPWVLVKMAELCKLPVASLALSTSRNAQRLFHLPDTLLEKNT
ncbi:MAG: hypothetical protein IBX50_04940 [Marinospirillum sp.]|uniref:hypothetical protein n=1 Tax=Marinospirillum sp. TaxID=2183934 RepID=UPI0019FAB6B9|nr:hypothetical protein [Marinospirillum sp.]MBE0506053.1 hypothetical protein [Marinospirillum sp.]